MNKRFISNSSKFLKQRARLTASITLLVCFAAASTLAQTNSVTKPVTKSPATAQANDEKAEQILKHAVEAVGGTSYLNVRSVIGRGLFTPFQAGISALPSQFVDYIVYPDRERTEFRGQGLRIIQTNTGNTGWLYDGGTRTLKDMTPEQVEDFKIGLRTTVDNLLRGYWRSEGAKLTYVGRREAGLARRNETVRLTYSDGFSVEFEFSARDGLPAKALYKRKRKNPDTEEIVEVAEEDRFAQYVAVGGTLAPFVIDHYAANQQTSRINYEAIEFNAIVPDTLFRRPANAKAIK